MSVKVKQFVFEFFLLALWAAFVIFSGKIASIVMSAIAGWHVGGHIRKFSTKVFHNDNLQS
jgi:hypothetical protein